MGDITLRALETLRGADAIACEDTRVTGKLLARHGIKTRMTAYHEHNAERVRGPLLARMTRGEAVALVSDAGTPLVSDPGFKLVRGAIEAGIPVTALPGPNAGIAGLVLSGLPTDRYFFAGFLPPKREARMKALRSYAAIPGSLIFYESPGRLAAALADIAEALGPRQAAVARELTKLYEEVRRGSLTELAAHYADAGAPKGEVLVIVGPPEAAAPPDAEALDEKLKAALAVASLRDAATSIAAETGLPRRLVYARAVALAGKN